MGKRYYCDYCDKTMAATPSIIRTHLKGLVHQKTMLDHYQRYKEPEIILAEETAKKPCSRFPQGQCQFGIICRYSHYSREQIDQLREIVANRKSKTDSAQPSFEDLYRKLQDQKSQPQKENLDKTVLCDNNGITHICPWVYNPIFESYDLPPSLKRIKIEDFKQASITTWG